jgi:Tfp pilus assembly protein PilN
MIRINLLPEEYRRSERTSPKIFGAILLAVILVCSTFGWFGYVYFGELGTLQGERAEAEERLAARQERVRYHDALQSEKSDYQQRAKMITEISQSRVLWTEVLDQMIDTVNNDGDTERHMAWFKSMSVTDGKGKEGPKVQMPGWVQGDDIKRLADFHDDLEQTPFFRNVQSKSLPSGDVNIDPKKKPAESLFFSLKWSFHPVEKWVTPQ